MGKCSVAFKVDENDLAVQPAWLSLKRFNVSGIHNIAG